ncbi:MAG: pro-sigmaK processing inhibitor BofA family protein [Halobacteria archaeon]|nr:pro-sigmaK processing inhibitor BofA family protein [Halobacteria archaeon]
MALIETGLLVTVVLVLAAIYYTRKVIKPLIYNSIVGLVILVLVNATGLVEVAYSPVAVLVIALGGTPGVVLVVLLAHLDLAFTPATLLVDPSLYYAPLITLGGLF